MIFLLGVVEPLDDTEVVVVDGVVVLTTGVVVVNSEITVCKTNNGVNSLTSMLM